MSKETTCCTLRQGLETPTLLSSNHLSPIKSLTQHHAASYKAYNNLELGFIALSVTDEFHFRDENIFYQFMIDRAVNKKMTDALGIVDDKTPGSPRNFRRRNLPPLNTQRSSPVPFSKERPGMNEPYGRQLTLAAHSVLTLTCSTNL